MVSSLVLCFSIHLNNKILTICFKNVTHGSNCLLCISPPFLMIMLVFICPFVSFATWCWTPRKKRKKLPRDGWRRRKNGKLQNQMLLLEVHGRVKRVSGFSIFKIEKPSRKKQGQKSKVNGAGAMKRLGLDLRPWLNKLLKLQNTKFPNVYCVHFHPVESLWH